MIAERERLAQADRREKHWRRWGPYLSERQWGTVREDYSPNGDAWGYFPFGHAHLRAYRWGEDGLLGISDNHQRLCFSIALWNGADPILKERLFGLTNAEGNHGEDIKEAHFHLESTPTHSWMRALYKYPQAAFPYAELRARSAAAGPRAHEPEIWDLGVFDGDRYFDVFLEYAKADVDDILIRITVYNRGSAPARLHLLPTLWFRNRWSWGRGQASGPVLRAAARDRIELEERTLGSFRFDLEGEPELLFTDNESNLQALTGTPGDNPYTKDAFHRRVISGERFAVNPARTGTKSCGWYQATVGAGASLSLRLRLRPSSAENPAFEDFDEIAAVRRAEAGEFFDWVHCPALSPDGRNVQRQALGGLLWTKQFYHYVVEDWLAGDPATPPPPAARLRGRNSEWPHVFTDDILSMPDKWEYPWFAAWDTAFHMIPMALVDPGFAKHQLQLLLREWYLHPNGQIPAYEWSFEDANPPVHAWAVWRVYKIDGKLRDRADREFLERCFHKLLMNFTWWINRKDSTGNNIFEGGFLGLDNIGVLDRSRPLPFGGRLEQSDATSWMAMYSLNMLRMALELAQENAVYEDIASKFLEHFLQIAHAMNKLGGAGLWDEREGFYYDRVRFDDGHTIPLRIRSLVGLIPLFAVDTFDYNLTANLEGFQRRTDWFIRHRPELSRQLLWYPAPAPGARGVLGLVRPDRLVRLLEVMLDEREFLSPYGIRSLSRAHSEKPFVLEAGGEHYRIEYEPAESSTRMFGGNSNWRGPVWFPVNYLLIESLQKFHHYLSGEFKVEFPTGSGRLLSLNDVAAELSRRLARLFLRDAQGRRPCYGERELFQTDPHFKDYLFFHEYFHGDNGTGLGACHQTGWTALVAKLLQQSGE